MFKISVPQTPFLSAEKPPRLRKKPIVKEPLAQSILLLSMIVVLTLDYLHVPYKVFVSAACASILLDVVVVAVMIWKTRRARQETRA
jgi:hypothetical protein